jgi:hypothetical protein
MIRRNSKHRMHGFVLPAPFAGIVVVGVLLALAYVWLGSRCDSLGREIKSLEREGIQLKKDIVNEESRWTKMKSPANLEMVLAKHNIVMTWPRQDQIVRLHETVGRSDVPAKRTDNSLTYVKREKAVIHD